MLNHYGKSLLTLRKLILTQTACRRLLLNTANVRLGILPLIHGSVKCTRWSCKLALFFAWMPRELKCRITIATGHHWICLHSQIISAELLEEISNLLATNYVAGYEANIFKMCGKASTSRDAQHENTLIMHQYFLLWRDHLYYESQWHWSHWNLIPSLDLYFQSNREAQVCFSYD